MSMWRVFLTRFGRLLNTANETVDVTHPLGLERVRWRDHGIGFCIGLVTFVFLVSTSDDVGVPRDESTYMYAAQKAGQWFVGLGDESIKSLSEAEIERAFKFNREHPVLMKSLFGLSHHYLHVEWKWTDNPVLAYRIPTMVMAGLSIWLTWILGLMFGGRLAGWAAAVALLCMPRYFFHAHLACFDAPATFMWLAGVYAFVRASASFWWAPVCGIFIGLGFATKLNIFFLPFTLLVIALIHVFAYRRQTGAWVAAQGEWGPLGRYGVVAFCIIVLGGLVFFAHWPWLYYETQARVGEYVEFHRQHEHYPVDYFGHLFMLPPFPMHFPWVMTILTVPLATLLLGGVGFVVCARRVWQAFQVRSGRGDRGVAECLLLINFVVPIMIISLPNTPIFGGTKHWMPAMPFLAIAAGIGAVRSMQGLWGQHGLRARQFLSWGTVILMLLPAGWATVTYSAHGPAYFNVLIGGPAGAARAELPRNFWGYSTVSVLERINASAPQNAYVFWHKATGGAMSAYKKAGLLRQDIRYSGDWSAPYSDWAVYHDQFEKLPEEVDIWRAYGTQWPVDGYFVDGVQLMSVYERPTTPIKVYRRTKSRPKITPKSVQRRPEPAPQLSQPRTDEQGRPVASDKTGQDTQTRP